MIGYDDKETCTSLGSHEVQKCWHRHCWEERRVEKKLSKRLRSLENRIDKNNKEHVDMLQKMRAETRELERLRGVWSERGLPRVPSD